MLNQLKKDIEKEIKGRVLLEKIDKLAEFMHVNYEILAQKNSWQTQITTQVQYHNLPPKNKKTMRGIAKLLYIEQQKAKLQLLTEVEKIINSQQVKPIPAVLGENKSENGIKGAETSALINRNPETADNFISKEELKESNSTSFMCPNVQRDKKFIEELKEETTCLARSCSREYKYAFETFINKIDNLATKFGMKEGEA